MHFFALITFVTLPFLVGAVPVSLNSSRAKGPRSFSLTRHSNYLNDNGLVDSDKLQAGIDWINARYDRTFRAYERRTGETHPFASKRRHSKNERRFIASNSLTNLSNSVWTVDVTVGTPGITIPMQLDSFSSDTWVSGTSCLTCFEHTRYDITRSSTAKDLHNQSTLTQLISNGPVTGETVSDVMAVGPNATTVTMVVATKIDLTFEALTFPGSGVLGIGKTAASSIGVPSWAENLAATPGLPDEEKVVGISFAASKFNVGGADSTLRVGTLFINPQPANQAAAPHWQFQLQGINIDSIFVALDQQTAIIDTTSPFISGEPLDITIVYEHIPGSAQDPTNPNLYTIPCNSTVNVVFLLISTGFTITPALYNLGPIDSTGNVCRGVFAVTNLAIWIMGEPFLQTAYVAFDYGKNNFLIANSIAPQN